MFDYISCLKYLRRNKIMTFDYIAVIDFEATSTGNDDDKENNVHRIIEFPVVLFRRNCIDGITHWEKTNDVFHHYCKPTKNEILSDWIINFTGITQAMIDKEGLLSFPEIVNDVYSFLCDSTGSNLDNVIIATWGHWDMKIMFPSECTNWDNMDYKDMNPVFKRYFNVKTSWNKLYNYGQKKLGMGDAIKHMGWELNGRHHSGIDDCKNIGRLMVDLLNRIDLNTSQDVFYLTSNTQM